MSTGISALYSEFTAALTEVRSTCVECSWTGASRPTRPPSRSTPNITNINTFWRWRLHWHSGKPYKTPVARKRPRR